MLANQSCDSADCLQYFDVPKALAQGALFFLISKMFQLRCLRCHFGMDAEIPAMDG